jgi:alginate O-acetyltransferase complex protein AlgI
MIGIKLPNRRLTRRQNDEHLSVAGPIVRPAHFLPQLKGTSHPDLDRGLRLILIGIFQKTVVADYVLAPVVDSYFTYWTHASMFDAWTAIIAFAVQIYCDFNGYTLCALGLALLLGFQLPANFDNPYAAIGFSDFWRRWHISLSTWIRDYLYIPLGGSRRGLGRTCLNLLVALTLAGLWHGASWNFALWGLIHGALLCIEHLSRTVLAGTSALERLSGRVLSSPLARAALWLLTFVVVCFAWVPFRAPSWDAAIAMLGQMVSWHDPWPRYIASADAALALAVAAMAIAVQIISRQQNSEVPRNVYVRWAAYGIMITLLVSMGGEARTFIYFKF